MAEKYFSVEQISEMLHIHPKTVQRYIREGKLNARKIGKSWRVSGHDLSLFTESEKPGAEKQEARASAVIDIPVPDADSAVRIANALTAALNTKPPEYGVSSMHTQYIGEENVIRITLWGSIRFMEAMFGFLSAFSEQEGCL